MNAFRLSGRETRKLIMGYIVVIILGVGVLGVAVLALLKPSRAKSQGQQGRPVGYLEPSADEPTAGASTTATASQKAASEKHTPPA